MQHNLYRLGYSLFEFGRQHKKKNERVTKIVGVISFLCPAESAIMEGVCESILFVIKNKQVVSANSATPRVSL